MKNIVITGSTSGIGYGLADSFLRLGCRVLVSGRDGKKVDSATEQLAANYDAKKVSGFKCDVRESAEAEALWNEAKRIFGTVDIWINNAGVAHPQMSVSDYEYSHIENVVNINIKGTLNGCIAALNGMREQGSGSLYNMEGLGSDGRVIRGLALYGLSKSAVGYLTKALAKEMKDTPIIIGGISPGMVATKLITSQYEGHPEEWAKVERLFNIISDRVETVTPWIAGKVINNRKNGARISWLSWYRLAGRFISSPFIKRQVFDSGMKPQGRTSV